MVIQSSYIYLLNGRAHSREIARRVFYNPKSIGTYALRCFWLETLKYSSIAAASLHQIGSFLESLQWHRAYEASWRSLDAEIFSHFPAGILNRFLSPIHGPASRWQLPQTPMPRFQIKFFINSRLFQGWRRWTMHVDPFGEQYLSGICYDRTLPGCGKQASGTPGVPIGKQPHSTVARLQTRRRQSSPQHCSMAPCLVTPLPQVSKDGSSEKDYDRQQPSTSAAATIGLPFKPTSQIRAWNRQPWVSTRLTGGAVVDARSRNLRVKYIKSWLQEMTRRGVLRQCNLSDLNFVSRLVFLPKPSRNSGESGAFRAIAHMRSLNKRSLSSEGSPKNPRLRDKPVVVWASACKFLYKLDIKDAFFCVPVAPNSQSYCGVTVLGKHYAFTSMPMGHKSSCAYFAKFMEWILSHLPEDDRCRIKSYCDDVFVAGNSQQDCDERVERVFFLFRFFGVQVNFEKSGRYEDVTILGHQPRPARRISLPDTRLQALQDLVKSSIKTLEAQKKLSFLRLPHEQDTLQPEDRKIRNLVLPQIKKHLASYQQFLTNFSDLSGEICNLLHCTDRNCHHRNSFQIITLLKRILSELQPKSCGLAAGDPLKDVTLLITPLFEGTSYHGWKAMLLQSGGSTTNIHTETSVADRSIGSLQTKERLIWQWSRSSSSTPLKIRCKEALRWFALASALEYFAPIVQALDEARWTWSGNAKTDTSPKLHVCVSDQSDITLLKYTEELAETTLARPSTPSIEKRLISLGAWCSNNDDRTGATLFDATKCSCGADPCFALNITMTVAKVLQNSFAGFHSRIMLSI